MATVKITIFLETTLNLTLVLKALGALGTFLVSLFALLW